MPDDLTPKQREEQAVSAIRMAELTEKERKRGGQSWLHRGLTFYERIERERREQATHEGPDKRILESERQYHGYMADLEE